MGLRSLFKRATARAGEDTEPLINRESSEEKLERFLLEAGRLANKKPEELKAQLRKKPVKLEDDDETDKEETLLLPHTDEALRQIARDRVSGFLSTATKQGSSGAASAIQKAIGEVLDEETIKLQQISGIIISTGNHEKSALAIGALVNKISDTDTYYRLDENDRDDDADTPHRDAKSLKATLTLVALLMETKAANAIASTGASIATKAAVATAAVAAVGALAFVGPLVAPVIVAGVAVGGGKASSKLVKGAINQLNNRIRSIDRDAMAEELSLFAGHEAFSKQKYDEQPENHRDPLKEPPQYCREALSHLIPPIGWDYWDGANASSRGGKLIRQRLP